MLTKSKILAGLQCDRRLHLLVHRPELADPSAGYAAIQCGAPVHATVTSPIPSTEDAFHG